MIEAGLPKYSQQLEEVSAAATKEYTLEKNLKKMKEEWVEIEFECIPYRSLSLNVCYCNVTNADLCAERLESTFYPPLTTFR